MSNQTPFDLLRIECWNKTFHTFAWEYIFNERAKSYSWKSNWLKVLGILVPAMIGATVISYEKLPEVKNASIALLTIISLIQFGLSILAIIYKWDDELSYSYEASMAYNSFNRRYKTLAQVPPNDYVEFKGLYDILDAESNARNQQDAKHNIRAWEKRKGMRYALRENQKQCVGCKDTPLSMDSTNCDICGKYSVKYKILNK